MCESDLFDDVFHLKWKDAENSLCTQQMFSRKCLKARFEAERLHASESSQARSNWNDALSSFSNVSAKQAFKNGAERLSNTINNVRSTFSAFSQKIKKSTKRRHPLVNMESPKSPVTPYARSRAALGRTPTKLYSPFSIDTPKGKENATPRARKVKDTKSGKSSKSKMRIKYDVGVNGSSNKSCGEIKLSNDLLQTQIGIYEFQSVANRIVQSGVKN